MRTVICSWAAAFLLSTLAAASTWIVTPDGTGDYPTIQAAINAGANGDSVALTDGTYTGDGNRDVDFLGKGITVFSVSGDPRVCIIDCEGGPEEYHRAFIFNSGEPPWAGLSGLTIMHAWEGWSSGGAIVCGSWSGPTIRNCIIRDNYGIQGAGLLAGGSPRSINVIDCTFQQNSGGAALLWYGGNDVFTNCTFVDNSLCGIMVTDTWPTLENCIIAGTADGPAILCYDQWLHSEVELSCCNLFGNFGGDWIGFIEDQLGINGNFSADPLFCLEAHPEAPYTLHENSPCMPGGHPPCGSIGAWGAGCPPAERACCVEDLCQILPEADCTLAGGTWLASFESCLPNPCDGVYRIRADGTGDFATIQEAVNASPLGHVIELDDGVFTGEGNINIDLWDKGITVRSASGNPELCIIDCEGHLAGPDEARRAFNLWRAEDPSTVIQGITLCSGNASASGAGNGGGAIYLGRHSSPTIINCIMRDNETIGYGGAIRFAGEASAHFRDCHFANNAVTGTSADGGAIWSGFTNAYFLRCTFTGNSATRSGGAVRLYDGEDSFENCTFIENSAPNGGAIAYWERSKAEALGCLFVGNSASLGGAAWADHYAEPTLINCTLYGHSTQNGGAVFSGNHAQFTLQNTIIAFSAEGSAVSCGGAEATLSCCDVYGNAGGDWIDCIADQLGQAGNIWEDPLFCAAGAGDFSLDGSSPCAPFTPPNPECDQIGAFDIGCGSSGTEPGEATIRILQLRPPAPNPFTEATSMTYLLPQTPGPARVVIDVIDTSGRRLRQLEDGIRAPGIHRARWDGMDQAGRQVPCGLYFIRLSANGEERRRSVLLMQ